MSGFSCKKKTAYKSSECDWSAEVCSKKRRKKKKKKEKKKKKKIPY